ncbi:hypothetical protein Gotur_025839 [Gossypium turneri]
MFNLTDIIILAFDMVGFECQQELFSHPYATSEVQYLELIKMGKCCSGDVDSVVPITSTRYAINKLKLPVKTAWRPWSINDEVGGYVEEYEGLTLVTVRDAGHFVPSYQPARALTMISSFLQGVLRPP